jgi:hypothetical protein
MCGFTTEFIVILTHGEKNAKDHIVIARMKKNLKFPAKAD